MSDNASAYFSAIRTEQARLERAFPDGFLHICSIKNLMQNSTGGTISHVTARQAAKHLCEATARVATPDEIADFQEKARAFNERMQAEQFTRNRSTPGGSVNLVIQRP